MTIIIFLWSVVFGSGPVSAVVRCTADTMAAVVTVGGRLVLCLVDWYCLEPTDLSSFV